MLRSRWAVLLAVPLLAGCGPRLATYPVQGTVAFPDGNVADLAASHVELQLASDPAVRADGLIGPDGRFSLQTLHQGVIFPGVPEGAYQARLLIATEDEYGKRKKPAPVHRRYTDFRTANLAVTVPTAGDVTLTVTRK